MSDRAKHLRVQCVNDECESSADTIIPIPIIAPGVVQWPQGLRCKTCGSGLLSSPVRVPEPYDPLPGWTEA